MSVTVTMLVLSAAVMHATWNALVKAGGDKLVMQCLVISVPGFAVFLALPFVPLPAPASWPLLLLSTIAHGIYYVTLLNSYRLGGLSQVYPIARGAAPLLIAFGALFAAGETLTPLEWLGVVIASIGIMCLAAPTGADRRTELQAIGFALATGVTIALYSVADGLGVRRAGDSMSYILWLLALEAIPMLAVGFWMRRGRIVASFRPHLLKGTLGGIIAGLGYGIVIWAMGNAQMAHVSALRETSVILAALIGTLLLGEPFGRRRTLAAALVAGGNALLHIGG
ncbi:MAG: EamA family transporter [Dongiaceae bacterium]